VASQGAKVTTPSHSSRVKPFVTQLPLVDFSPPTSRRVIFPMLYKEKIPITREVKEPQVEEPQVDEPQEPKAGAAFCLEALEAQSLKNARGIVDALLPLSPLKKRISTPENNKKSSKVSHPVRPQPMKTMHRPAPLTSLEIPERWEENTLEPKPCTRRLPPRNTLIRNHSFPTPEGPPKGKLTNLISILRTSRSFCPMKRGLLSTSDRSIPSLVSLKDEEECSQSSNEVFKSALDIFKLPVRRSVSEPSRKTIVFDPRIWVREFVRSEEELTTTWYTEDDMERFKRQAVALIMVRNSTEIIPTGTSRTVQRPVARIVKAFYTHAALTLEGAGDPIEALKNQRYRGSVAKNELRSILLVDPRDICLTLFTKALKTILPNAEICTATTSEEALKFARRGKNFDIVLVEECLKNLFHSQNNRYASTKTAAEDHAHSGSALFRTLSRMPNTHNALFIGVSAHLARDESRLEQGGADLCWSKPPPKMSQELLNQLIKTLLLKRGRKTIADELFGSS
jgi:CheY-like chemotaxis protein